MRLGGSPFDQLFATSQLNVSGERHVMRAVIQSTKRRSNFFPVPTTAFPATCAGRYCVYLRDAETERFRLYSTPESPIGARDLAKLGNAGIETVYLETAQYDHFQELLRSTFASDVKNESLPVTQRFGILNEVVRGVLRDTFKWGSPAKVVEQSRGLATHVVDLICRDDVLTTELSAVLHHDYATFTHSANVAYYAVMLAKSLGYNDPDQLKVIATGGLVHDIGKLEIPESILRKNGRLTTEEIETIRRHPGLGMLSLGPQQAIEFGQLMMVYQHHERVDGTGYPVQVPGKEIHEWARICTIADVFEAFTSNRPYRKRWSVPTALEMMEREAGKSFDAEFFRCWQQTICKN
jgi:HD-GYP domain-containing protein (c-di-GMP phosphodiesterase class II)